MIYLYLACTEDHYNNINTLTQIPIYEMFYVN